MTNILPSRRAKAKPLSSKNSDFQIFPVQPRHQMHSPALPFCPAKMTWAVPSGEPWTRFYEFRHDRAPRGRRSQSAARTWQIPASVMPNSPATNFSGPYIWIVAFFVGKPRKQDLNIQTAEGYIFYFPLASMFVNSMIFVPFFHSQRQHISWYHLQSFTNLK